MSVSALAANAYAGGFINSSQSSVFNGMAYAGAAAGGSSSAATMFYNPATMTGFRGLTIDTNYTFGMPSSRASGSYNAAGAGLNALLPGAAKYDKDYFVPASYLIYQINDSFWAGLSINSTYGNQTKADTFWRGSLLAASTKLRIITATPSLAYKLNDMWSFGVGMQIQYASARLPAAKVIAYGYLVPAFVIVFEGLAGHGWASLSIAAGAAITVLGLVVLAVLRD